MRSVGQNNANSKTEPNQFYQIDITLSERVTNYLTPALRKSERGFLRFFFPTMLHLPLLRFHCVGGCWN
jgi:hypothetical protein